MYSGMKFEEIRHFSDNIDDITNHMILKKMFLVQYWNLNLKIHYIQPPRSSRLGEKSVFRSMSPAYIDYRFTKNPLNRMEYGQPPN